MMLRLRLSRFVYAAACCYLLHLAVAQVTDPSEVSALQAVKNSLNDPVKHLRNWGRGDPCTSNWTGVLCFDTVSNDSYLHVQELQLWNMNLSGSLSPELGRLSRLWILDFMWNDLTGSIPKEIGSLSALVLLLLNGNKLSGSLPDELGYLSKLNRLQVDQNHLTGPIPKSFANLSNVRHLHLNNNSFNGQIPAELCNLSSLLHLLLDNNNFFGNLPPEISQLPELRILQLDNNQFNGSEIPATYGNFSKLAKLSLRNCGLQGAVPDLSGIPSLFYLDLSRNQLTGPIPSNKLSDNMTTIDLSYNNLNGTIPGSFSDLPSLQNLSLANNSLRGLVPADMWQSKNFSTSARLTLDLRNNQLLDISGELVVPDNVTLRSLRNCSLQGAVPDLSGIRGLLYLDLSQNHLTGPIPSNKLSDNMTTIDLSDNRLNGSIPANFSDLHLLQKLDLGNNQLSNISEGLHFPDNVTLRLRGNPICIKANIPHIDRFCGNEAGEESFPTHTTNSTMSCPTEACPVENFFEYVPASPVPCFCASPLRIEYRLKSPSFVYFLPYNHSFEEYLTQTLNLDLYQLSIELFVWEKGPRLHMHIKLFPKANYVHSNTFNASEVQRIRHRFTTWDFPRNDLFGPYELLNFTLLGPYATLNAETRRTGITGGILAAIIVGAVVCVVAISATVTLLIKRRVHARNQHSLSRTHLSSSRASMKLDGVKNFKFRELAEATANFNSSNQVGRGGYGKVYKGVLSDNTVVAIKRAEEGSLQGQKEFLTEIKLLSRLHHRNLVSLVGYCDEEAEQMLVYEFMPNGTLWDWLSAKGKESLNFSMRLRIALDSARGILYLHTDANPPVFHRDIKASNILLDSKLNAKVADFGLSRLAPVMDEDGTVPTHVSTIVKGTPGYLDPEYFLTHKLTDKSDVYSFGIVLLELLTGERPISQGKNIVRQVNMAHQSGMTFSIIDTRMGSCPSECIEGLVALALSCCHDKPKHRPSMLEVVRELENIVKMVPEGDTILSQYTTPMFSSQSASSSSTMVPRGSYLLSHVSGSDLKSDVIPIIKPR